MTFCPASVILVSVRPLRGSGLIVCDPTLVFAVIDALFGGAGKFHTRIEGRDFSPTETRIITRLVEVIVEFVEAPVGKTHLGRDPGALGTQRRVGAALHDLLEGPVEVLPNKAANL